MLENKRSPLSHVALEAILVFCEQGCATALDHGALVRVVAICAAYLAFQYWMMVRQIELSLLVEVALEASFRGFLRVYDGVGGAATLIVDAAGTVAALAAHFPGVFTARDQSGVVRRFEGAYNFLVAIRATG